MIHSIIDKARRDRYRMMKGFYHGERMGFMDRESGSAEIIHAVRLPRKAFACGKLLRELEPPEGVSILEVHRDTLIMATAEHPDLLLQVGDVVVLLGMRDKLDPGESYLLRG